MASMGSSTHCRDGALRGGGAGQPQLYAAALSCGLDCAIAASTRAWRAGPPDATTPMFLTSFDP